MYLCDTRFYRSALETSSELLHSNVDRTNSKNTNDVSKKFRKKLITDLK